MGGGAGQRARERGQSTHMICCIQIVIKCLNAHETGARARSVPQPLRHVRSAARMLSNSRVSMSERHRQFDQSPNVGLSMKRENGRALEELSLSQSSNSLVTLYSARGPPSQHPLDSRQSPPPLQTRRRLRLDPRHQCLPKWGRRVGGSSDGQDEQSRIVSKPLSVCQMGPRQHPRHVTLWLQRALAATP